MTQFSPAQENSFGSNNQEDKVWLWSGKKVYNSKTTMEIIALCMFLFCATATTLASYIPMDWAH